MRMKYTDMTKECKYGFIIWHPEFITNHNYIFDNYIFEPLSNHPEANKIRVIVITDIILKDEYKDNYF